jgi:hypothetical protein
MISETSPELRPAHAQAYASSTSQQIAPHKNALKHGLRSAAILLPGDDGEQFERLRRELFRTYGPRTGDEAACVESMAGYQWRIARCRRWQAACDARLDTLLQCGPGGTAAHICESDPHPWMHCVMDCTLHESRLDRLMHRALEKLLLLQKLRRNNLVAGAVESAPHPETFAWWDAPAAAHPGVAPVAAPAGVDRSATDSTDGEIGENDKRNVHPRESGGSAEPADAPGAAASRPGALPPARPVPRKLGRSMAF